MNKSFRQGQILKIIRSKEIYTQEELARELQALGIPATQVTLSRDIRELGLAKTAGGYRPMPVESAGPTLEDVVNEFLQDIRIAQNQIILKTSREMRIRSPWCSIGQGSMKWWAHLPATIQC